MVLTFCDTRAGMVGENTNPPRILIDAGRGGFARCSAGLSLERDLARGEIECEGLAVHHQVDKLRTVEGDD